MPSTSQSVNRSMAIFELFAEHKRALSAQEIIASLDMPKSSCTALLRTLIELGMLELDRKKLSYIPTYRFAQLGAWLLDELQLPSHLLDSMDTLARRTNETITLASYNDMELVLVRVCESPQAISFSAAKGQKFSVWRSALGYAILANKRDGEIKRLHARAIDRLDPSIEHTSLDSLLENIERTRKTGFAVAEGAVFPDATAIAIDAKSVFRERPLVLAIAGPSARLQERVSEYGELLKAAIEQKL